MINKDQMEILNNLMKESPSSLESHIVLVDAMNLFFRNFAVHKTINLQGHHMGGLVGFLRSLGYLNKNLNPTKIVVVFDGVGSSDSRKLSNPDYKSNRDISKLIDPNIFEDVNDLEDSMGGQLGRLVEYLKQLPVHLLSIGKIEADDTIAYIAKNWSKDNKITIVSTDEDYCQILGHNVYIYSPSKKLLIDSAEFNKKYDGLTPKNYLIVKAICGDNSDNLKGIKGIGIPTCLKIYPQLKEKEDVTLNDIYEYSSERVKDSVRYARVIKDFSRIESNYDLMNLQEPNVGENQIEVINEEMNRTVNNLNYGSLNAMQMQDGIEGKISYSLERWSNSFRKLQLK